VVDVIYIAASSHDAAFTRTCVASIRRFYPDIPIRLLVGGPLERGLAHELRRFFGVGVAELPKREYGWGFVKLEPLFKATPERFLVLDSDTVITGPVLKWAGEHDSDFIVDSEEQTAERGRQIYYDSERAAQDGSPVAAPAFLFNTGQWFGRSGVLTREHFQGLVEWSWPRRVARPQVFKNGEQGILNFVVNEQVRLGVIRTARVPLMRWPGHGMHELDAQAVSRRSCPALVVHWAGMSRMRRHEVPGADVLAYLERQYYGRIPFGPALRVVHRCQGVLAKIRR
jgi:hypothetical protein